MAQGLDERVNKKEAFASFFILGKGKGRGFADFVSKIENKMQKGIDIGALICYYGKVLKR